MVSKALYRTHVEGKLKSEIIQVSLSGIWDPKPGLIWIYTSGI